MPTIAQSPTPSLPQKTRVSHYTVKPASSPTQRDLTLTPPKGVAFVSGATSVGIGLYVAMGLLEDGYDVICVARNAERAGRLRRLAKRYPNRKVDIRVADMANVNSIRRVCGEIRRDHTAVDIVVNSLGLMSPKWDTTDDGVEVNLAVNAYAPVLLVTELLPLLLNAKKPKVVQLSSDGHKAFGVDARTLQEPRCENNFSMFVNYGAAKLTALMLNYELQRRLDAAGLDVRINNVHPGFVRTELGRGMGTEGNAAMRLAIKAGALGHKMFVGVAPYVAAAPILHLALAEQHHDTRGAYFAGARRESSSDDSKDEALAKALWQEFCARTGSALQFSDAKKYLDRD